MLKIAGPFYMPETGGIPDRVIGAAAEGRIDPYGPERGTVKIRLGAAAGLAEELTLLFTEHRSQNRKQHVIAARMGKEEVSVDLPSGEYTMQILARGFETVRGLAEVDPKRPFVVDALFKPREKRVRTFEERLARYGVDAANAKIGELTVAPKKNYVLNYENERDKNSFKLLDGDTIAKIKQWVGSEDARFGHSKPVFGPLPDRQYLARLRDGIDFGKLEPAEIQAVKSIAREYVHGNSKAVALYESVLNEAIKLTLQDAKSKIALHFYRVVTIGAGATLEIGNGSAIFVCDELRIHKTGNLKPVADVNIEVGTYTEFQ